MNITEALESVGTNVWNGTKAVGSAVGGAVERWWENQPGNRERTERERNEATETKALRTLMQVYDPDGKDKYTAMGLGELRGSAQAIAVKQHMQQLAKQQQQDQAEQMFYQLANPAAPGGMGPDAPMTPGRIFNAASKSGYHLPPTVLAQMVKEGDGVNWGDITPRPFEIDGVRGAVGKSGQFQFLPSQIGDSMQAVPVLDDEGNVIDFRVPNGKGGTSPIRKPATKTLPEAYNSRVSTLLDDIAGTEGTLAKSDDEITKLYRRPAAEQRQALNTKLAATRKQLADHVARYEEQGYADGNFWNTEKQRLGLAAKPAGAAAGGNYPKARNPKTGETLIYKDGKWQKE